MANIKLNFNKRTIEVTKSFMKAASIYNSDQYKEFLAVQRDYPTYSVVVMKEKRNTKKDTYSGLTLEVMEKYIASHDDGSCTAMNKFKDLRGNSDIANALDADSYTYGEIKKWFLNQYPEVKNFYQNRLDLVNKETA